MKENVIMEKSFAFSVRIVNLRNYLIQEKKEFQISNQINKSGTSIGANVAEAQQAQSRPDFVSKLNIALKEAVETSYWLRLLHATDYLTKTEYDSIYADCQELEKLLTAIIKTTKE